MGLVSEIKGLTAYLGIHLEGFLEILIEIKYDYNAPRMMGSLFSHLQVSIDDDFQWEASL